jgi:hypothetical protein
MGYLLQVLHINIYLIRVQQQIFVVEYPDPVVRLLPDFSIVKRHNAMHCHSHGPAEASLIICIGFSNMCTIVHWLLHYAVAHSGSQMCMLMDVTCHM